MERDLGGDKSPWKDRAFEVQQWSRTLRTRRWMKALESMRPGARQPARKGPTSSSTAGGRVIATPTPDRTTRAPRGNPRGADRRDRKVPAEGSPRPPLRSHPARDESSGRDGTGTGARRHPQESPRTNRRETRRSWNPPPRSLRSRAETGPPPPARAGKTGRERREPQPGSPRQARPFEGRPARVDGERSGVATPGTPASAGTTEVRRAGGLRGPHADVSGPAPEGRARRRLRARTEGCGGATGSITTRTEGRVTGPSE